MYWFCGVNDNSQNHKDMYITALRSSKYITNLTPIIIYDGADSNFVESVNQLGGNVVKYSSGLNSKPVFQKKPEDWKAIAKGAFLRVDIPIICKYLDIVDEYVLYTDTDVIFMKDVVDELQKFKPKYFNDKIKDYNIYDWEKKFLDQPVTNNQYYELYLADIDTTFALLNKNIPYL